MHTIPTFPTELGEEHGVEFLKDGQWYRLVRVGEMTWLIHRRGETAERFEIMLSGTSPFFDVEGRNGLVQLHGSGMSPTTIFTKLF